MPLKILFCYKNSFNPNIGGVQKVCDILAKYFVQQDIEVCYLTSHREETSYKFPGRVFVLPNDDFFSEENALYYSQLITDLSIDIVINNDATNERSKFFVDTRVKTVSIVSIFHQNPLQGLNDPHPKKVLRFLPFFNTFLYPKLKRIKRRKQINELLLKSDKLILLSERFKIGLQKELSIISDKIVCISNPLTLNEIVEVKKMNKSKKVIFVGRLEFGQKRPDRLVNIWKLLEQNYPDWSLYFVGDGPDRDKLEKMVADLGLQNVFFEGFKDPIPYYQEAAVLCMTSDFEGFGLVLLEAMSLGVVPVVFNNWENLQDIVTHQKTGFLIPKDDINNYVQTMEYLLNNEKARTLMSDNAKESVANFSIEIVGLAWLELFDSLKKTN